MPISLTCFSLKLLCFSKVKKLVIENVSIRNHCACDLKNLRQKQEISFLLVPIGPSDE